MTPAMRELVRWLASEAISEVERRNAHESGTLTDAPQNNDSHDRSDLRPLFDRQAV